MPSTGAEMVKINVKKRINIIKKKTKTPSKKLAKKYIFTVHELTSGDYSLFSKSFSESHTGLAKSVAGRLTAFLYTADAHFAHRDNEKMYLLSSKLTPFPTIFYTPAHNIILLVTYNVVTQKIVYLMLSCH
jgi:hypothetical protein